MKCSCMKYLSKVTVLLAVDGGLDAPSLEKQTEVPARNLSNVLLWIETITSCSALCIFCASLICAIILFNLLPMNVCIVLIIHSKDNIIYICTILIL